MSGYRLQPVHIVNPRDLIRFAGTLTRRVSASTCDDGRDKIEQQNEMAADYYRSSQMYFLKAVRQGLTGRMHWRLTRSQLEQNHKPDLEVLAPKQYQLVRIYLYHRMDYSEDADGQLYMLWDEDCPVDSWQLPLLVCTFRDSTPSALLPL
jgi:hypothetical protein